MVVPVRNEDTSLAEELMGSAMQRYEENFGMEVNLKNTQSYFYKLLFFNTYLKVTAFIIAYRQTLLCWENKLFSYIS